MDSSRYKVEGYAIYRGVVELKKIKSFVREFKKFKKRKSLFYSQSTHRWLLTQKCIDEFGSLEESIQDFTDLVWTRGMSRKGREILLSSGINDCLSELDYEGSEFCMWQNMIFDKSTSTVDHIDSWYLDTTPMGRLIGAWVALEDITGDGGAFHVYPGTHLETYPDEVTHDHSRFLRWCADKSKNYDRKELLVNAGDVIFWHPNLIHGSSGQRVKGKTRMSLTAHYHAYDLPRYEKKGKATYRDQFSRHQKFMKNRYELREGLPIYTKKLHVRLQGSIIHPIRIVASRLNRPAMRMGRDIYMPDKKN